MAYSFRKGIEYERYQPTGWVDTWLGFFSINERVQDIRRKVLKVEALSLLAQLRTVQCDGKMVKPYAELTNLIKEF